MPVCMGYSMDFPHTAFQGKSRHAERWTVNGDIFMHKIVTFVLSGILITACVPEEDAQQTYEEETPQTYIGTSYSQCANHPVGTMEGSPEVTITIDRLVPVGAEIQCSDTKDFPFEGSNVSLVYVAYGALQDCLSGCFSSYLCGIYEPDKSLLYSFSWYGSVEKPLSIPEDCPALATAESGQTSGCDTPPPGFDHPVTMTDEFEAFRKSQLEQNGDWRFCFF